MVRIKDRIVSRYYATPRQYDVVVYTESGHYYAKDEKGNTICIDSPTACLQEAVDRVAQLGGGRILVRRGTYYPTKTVAIPDGIKLIIEGEGDSTVFRYTDSFTLFFHTSRNPTWTSVLSFRNFKVDRSGSGGNKANIIYVLYALYDEYDNITIVDDYREVAEDVGLYGRNSIVSIVRNSRFFNKASPVWFHSYLVHIHSNYARNTSLIGFAAGHLLPESVFGYKQPPGYPLDGLVVIENNMCIDCGRRDEAYAVDNEGGNPYTYGTGIIRDNTLISQDYSIQNAGIICVNVDKCYIENNTVNINSYGPAVNMVWKNVRSSLIRIKGNKIRANILSNSIPFGVSVDRAVIDDNDIDITVTADGSDTSSINWGMKLEAYYLIFTRNKITYNYPKSLYNQRYFVSLNGYMKKIILKDNYISVTYPQNILTSYGIDLEDNVSKNVEFVDIENNIIAFSAGRPLSVNTWGTYQTPPLVKIVGNKFYSGSSTNILIGVRANSTVKTVVFGNTLEGGVSGLSLYADSGLTPTLIFLHRDMPIVTASPNITIRYTNRNSGMATFSGDGVITQFKIMHGLISTPSRVLVTPASENAARQFYITADSTYIYVNYLTAPPAGTNNVVLYWYAEV